MKFRLSSSGCETLETKRLRYVLEFLRGLSDPCVDEGIEALVALRDRLGELHDADVTMEMLRDLVANRAEAQPEAVDRVPAISGYFDAQSVRLQTLRSTLPATWPPRHRALRLKGLSCGRPGTESS